MDVGRNKVESILPKLNNRCLNEVAICSLSQQRNSTEVTAAYGTSYTGVLPDKTPVPAATGQTGQTWHALQFDDCFNNPGFRSCKLLELVDDRIKCRPVRDPRIGVDRAVFDQTNDACKVPR